MKSANIDVVQLLKDYRSGMSVLELSVKFNVTKQTICYRLRTNGIHRVEKRGNRKSTAEDLTGEKVGKFLIIERIKTGNKYYYKCQCSCKNKNIKLIRSDGIKINKKLHCGCENFVGYGDISISFFKMIRRNALSYGREFKLTIEYLWDLFLNQKGKCKYSGQELSLPLNSRKAAESTASLDRIDSSKDYIEGNVQWVHKDINQMKMDLSNYEFIKWCRLVSDNYQDKEIYE